MFFVKRTGWITLVLLFGILFTACHRDLSDPFVPKVRKFDTQFKFDKKRNRTVEKHVSFSKGKGKFKDSFGGRRAGGGKSSGGKDSFSSRSKKESGGNRFSKSKGRVVEKGSSRSRNGKDSFASRSGNSKKKNRMGGKDTYSSATKKQEKGNRFSKSNPNN